MTGSNFRETERVLVVRKVWKFQTTQAELEVGLRELRGREACGLQEPSSKTTAAGASPLDTDPQGRRYCPGRRRHPMSTSGDIHQRCWQVIRFDAAFGLRLMRAVRNPGNRSCLAHPWAGLRNPVGVRCRCWFGCAPIVMRCWVAVLRCWAAVLRCCVCLAVGLNSGTPLGFDAVVGLDVLRS
jgi:hypothetical protein